VLIHVQFHAFTNWHEQVILCALHQQESKSTLSICCLAQHRPTLPLPDGHAVSCSGEE
jgi:hypothetical protein